MGEFPPWSRRSGAHCRGEQGLNPHCLQSHQEQLEGEGERGRGRGGEGERERDGRRGAESRVAKMYTDLGSLNMLVYLTLSQFPSHNIHTSPCGKRDVNVYSVLYGLCDMCSKYVWEFEGNTASGRVTVRVKVTTMCVHITIVVLWYW